MSFSEYIQYKGIRQIKGWTSKDKAILRHHAERYLQRGGFLETLELSDALHTQIIQSYVNSAVFRDVIDRYELKNSHLVKLFLLHCLQNICSPLSVTKVFHTLKSLGEELSRGPLYEYLEYFEDAYLICGVPVFDFSARKRQVNPQKVYCIDSGIISSYSIKPQMELSTCLENAVYVQLRRMSPENIFYYKTKSGKEIDFVAQFPNGKLELYQVSLHIQEEKTRQRELGALIEAAEELGVERASVITLDTAETLPKGSLVINVLPYWQWALQPLPSELVTY